MFFLWKLKCNEKNGLYYLPFGKQFHTNVSANPTVQFILPTFRTYIYIYIYTNITTIDRFVYQVLSTVIASFHKVKTKIELRVAAFLLKFYVLGHHVYVITY